VLSVCKKGRGETKTKSRRERRKKPEKKGRGGSVRRNMDDAAFTPKSASKTVVYRGNVVARETKTAAKKKRAQNRATCL